MKETIKVRRTNRYNPNPNQPFYLDPQGNPTKERLGELLFVGDYWGAKEVTDKLEESGDFDYEWEFEYN
jgi:hypothetical protein